MSTRPLSLLLKRAMRRPYLDRPMASEALRAIAMLRSGDNMDHELEVAFVGIARREQSVIGEAMQKLKVDPLDPTHGYRVVQLLSCFERLHCDDNMWSAAVAHVEVGLHYLKWRPKELSLMLRDISEWGMYNSKTLPEAIDKYVGHRVHTAKPDELADVAGILTSLVETTKSPQVKLVAEKAVKKLPEMYAADIGTLCKHFASAIYTDKELLAAVIDQLPRILTDLKGPAVVGVFVFWANHGFPDVTEEDKEQEIDCIGGLIRQMARTLASYDDVPMFISVLRGLLMLPISYWRLMPEELDSALSTISNQCRFLLRQRNPMIPAHTVVSLMPKYFQLADRRPQNVETENPNVEPTIEEFCSHLTTRLEDLVSEESPPFFLVPALLNAKRAPCRKVALEMLKEAAVQDVALPTLQTFRFLLTLADHNEWDRKTANFLRKNFAFTTDGIPAVQLCTALRCLAMAETTLRTQEEEERAKNGNPKLLAHEIDEKQIQQEDFDRFLEDMVVAVEHPEFRAELRSIMSLVSTFHILKPPKRLTRRLLQFASSTMDRLCSAATPNAFSVKDAETCLLYYREAQEVDQGIVIPEQLREFLIEVTVKGDVNDGKLTPSAWMKAHDPSGMILPRTEEQKKIDSILLDLRLCPSNDSARIAELGKQYVEMLGHLHPDEARVIFEIFAERVIKQDKILRDVMQWITKEDRVSQMAPYAIASILSCCGYIRFAYYKLMKEMVTKCTEEQMSHLDAYELEQLVTGMAKAGIRVAPVLAILGDRAIAIAPTLNGQQAASLIHSFQSIGMHEDAVTSALLKRITMVAEELTAGSMMLLLGGHHSHRLPITPMIALPIVQRLNEVVPDMMPYQRNKIGGSLKKCTHIPRELLTGAQGALQIEAGSKASTDIRGLPDASSDKV